MKDNGRLIILYHSPTGQYRITLNLRFPESADLGLIQTIGTKSTAIISEKHRPRNQLRIESDTVALVGQTAYKYHSNITQIPLNVTQISPKYHSDESYIRQQRPAKVLHESNDSVPCVGCYVKHWLPVAME